MAGQFQYSAPLPSCVVQHVTRDGMTVRLCVLRLRANEWILRVHGQGDQVSEWMQCFATPFEAMVAGHNALAFEGIEQFYSDPLLQVRGKCGGISQVSSSDS